MTRTPAHVADMLDFIRELRSLLGARALADYLSDRVLNLAVEKLFINLGEAAARIPDAERSVMRDIPWRQIIGVRNILAHGYEQIDHETLFRSVTADLPALEDSLDRWLSCHTGGNP
jgi:uncharacterized protein with HEPN domain